jgi:transcriptional regulator with XRE-family HTH domain
MGADVPAGARPFPEAPAPDAEDSPAEATVLRMLLGAQLRRLREAAGVPADKAGFEIRSSRSKISRMENGRVGFKLRDIEDLLTLYGVTDGQQRAEVVTLARQSSAPDWWTRYGDLLPGWFETYLGLESAAVSIRSFEVQFVPGLFQTEDYVRAVTRLGHQTASADEIERRVALRARRQELLARPAPPRVWAVLDEAVLRRAYGGPGVLRAQLVHLAAAARLPHVTLQVVPFSRGGHAGASGAFSLLRFAERDLPDVVYLEQLTSAVYLDQRADEAWRRIDPDIVFGARANRAFLGRAVRYLAADAGVRQFLDIGTGIPTAGNTHQVAQAIAPEARVVYVDYDPVVLAHARALLSSTPEGATEYIDADLRDTPAILDRAARVLDFTQPVAVTLMAVLHAIPDSDDPYAIMAAVMGAVPPGSYLALSHSASDLLHAGQRTDLEDVNNRMIQQRFTYRDREQVARFFVGMDLVAPGLVRVEEWRPDPGGAAEGRSHLWCAMARKR